MNANQLTSHPRGSHSREMIKNMTEKAHALSRPISRVK